MGRMRRSAPEFGNLDGAGELFGQTFFTKNAGKRSLSIPLKGKSWNSDFDPIGLSGLTDLLWDFRWINGTKSR